MGKRFVPAPPVIFLDISDQYEYNFYIWGTAIALDMAGDVCVTGRTDSESFPTINPYQSSYAGWYGSERYGRGDAFITGVSATGSSLIFSTCLGGSHADSGPAVKLFPDGSLYIAIEG